MGCHFYRGYKRLVRLVPLSLSSSAYVVSDPIERVTYQEVEGELRVNSQWGNEVSNPILPTATWASLEANPPSVESWADCSPSQDLDV